jgi:hypothetical protein
MQIDKIESHKYIKLLEYALENRNFTKVQACEASGLSQSDFDFIKWQIFSLSAAQESFVSPNEEHEWKLAPQAFFNYLQFQEFKHAVNTAEVSKSDIWGQSKN